MKRRSDYSPSRERALREGQQNWSARSFRRPDPMADRDASQRIVYRLFWIVMALMFAMVIQGAVVYFRARGV